MNSALQLSHCSRPTLDWNLNGVVVNEQIQLKEKTGHSCELRPGFILGS